MATHLKKYERRAQAFLELYQLREDDRVKSQQRKQGRKKAREAEQTMPLRIKPRRKATRKI